MPPFSGTPSPCAACKFLRRKCTPDCIFAPYFPPENPAKFANVHKVFGASNVGKILSDIHHSRRQDAADSLAFEAEARLLNPVYGCVGHVSYLYQHLQHLQQRLHAARAELSQYMAAAGVSNELPPSLLALQATIGDQQQHHPPMAPSTYGLGSESTASTEQQYAHHPGAAARNPGCPQNYNYTDHHQMRLEWPDDGGSGGATATMEREQQFLSSQQQMAVMARREQPEMTQNFFLMPPQQMVRREQSGMTQNYDRSLFDAGFHIGSDYEHGEGSVGINHGGGSGPLMFPPSPPLGAAPSAPALGQLFTPSQEDGQNHLQQQRQRIIEPGEDDGMARREQSDMTQNYDLNLFDDCHIGPAYQRGDGSASITGGGSKTPCTPPSGLLTSTEEDGQNHHQHRQRMVQPSYNGGMARRGQSKMTQGIHIGSACEHGKSSVSISGGGSCRTPSSRALGLLPPGEKDGKNHQMQQIVVPGDKGRIATHNHDHSFFDGFHIDPANEHGDSRASVNSGMAPSTPALGLSTPTEEDGQNHRQQTVDARTSSKG